MKQLIQITITWLNIPNGGRQTSCVFTKRDQGVKLGSPSCLLACSPLSGQSGTRTHQISPFFFNLSKPIQNITRSLLLSTCQTSRKSCTYFLNFYHLLDYLLWNVQAIVCRAWNYGTWSCDQTGAGSPTAHAELYSDPGWRDIEDILSTISLCSQVSLPTVVGCLCYFCMQ